LVRTSLLRPFVIKTISIINTLEVLKAIPSPSYLDSHIFASSNHHQDNQYNQHFRSAQGYSLPTLVRTFLLRPFIIKTISTINTLEVLKAISFSP
jgi:hypothetical protein